MRTRTPKPPKPLRLRDRIAEALADQFTADEMVVVRRALSIVLTTLIKHAGAAKA